MADLPSGADSMLPPLPAHGGGGEGLVAGAEEGGIEERLRRPAGEGRGAEIDGQEVRPAAGGDPPHRETERTRTSLGRRPEEGAADLARLPLPEHSAALAPQSLDVLQPAHL